MDEQQTGVQQVEEQTPITEAPTVEAPEAVQSPDDSDDLPQDSEKARQAFIRERQEKRELKKRLEALESRTPEEQSMLDSFRGGYNVELDPLTSDIDTEQFVSRMSVAEKKAYEAERRVSNLERQLEDQVLFNEFPELNPKNKDLYSKPETKAFEEYVAGQYVLAQLNGKKANMIEIARQAKERFGVLTAAQKEQIASQAVEELQKKEQASVGIRGTSQAPSESALAQEEDLRDRARRGGPEGTEALKKLMKLRRGR